MGKFNLKRLLRKRDEAALLGELLALSAEPVAVFAEDGEMLCGVDAADAQRIALEFDGERCGWVQGPVAESQRIARLITHLVHRELEKSSLAQDGLEKYREITLLYNIGEQIFSCLDPVEIGRFVINELQKLITCDSSSVMLYCEETDTLNILAAFGREHHPKVVLPRGKGIAGSVMVTGKAEIINATASDSRFITGPTPIGSLMCVPLMTKESCIGVINISRGEVRDFSARDLRLVATFASQAAIAIENAQLYENLREHNKSLEKMVAERTNELNISLVKVEAANRLIRQTFGRYLSDDLVDDILSSPERAALGGESRLITIMMTDLRGFTAISDRLPANDVLNIINIYLERMTEVVMKHNGTIIEFIGDAILAVFGAPVSRDDDAKRGVACAIEMQNAMTDVNARCRELGYPEIAQGIGINTGESVVGNIGSDKRTKYGIVGMHVNLTSRIESYTVGGQILISETTARECGAILKVVDTLEVMPKGVQKPLTLFDVAGIEGEFNVFLPNVATLELRELKAGLPVSFFILEGKHATMNTYQGTITKLSPREAVVHSETLADPLSNLKLSMVDDSGAEVMSNCYVKVIESPCSTTSAFKVNFTSIPPEAADFLNRVLSDDGGYR